MYNLTGKIEYTLNSYISIVLFSKWLMFFLKGTSKVWKYWIYLKLYFSTLIHLVQEIYIPGKGNGVN